MGLLLQDFESLLTILRGQDLPLLKISHGQQFCFWNQENHEFFTDGVKFFLKNMKKSESLAEAY